MLEPVPLLEKNLDFYAVAAGEEVVERIRALAEPLRGARVLHINATAYGGGVAENLATHVALLRAAGLDAHWRLIGGSSDFFVATKAIHNALQGMKEVEWSIGIQDAYLDHARGTVSRLESGWDFVVVHDPQPLALLSSLEEDRDGARWIWRCHIDLTTPRPEAAEFIGPLVAGYDATVWTLDSFVPDWPDLPHVEVFPPAIDPLVPKNLDLGYMTLYSVAFGVLFARWYLTRDDVRVPLEPTATRTRCPYKGEARYWSVRLPDGRELTDAVWSYPEPLPESSRIAGQLGFLHEGLTVLVDGEPA